MAEEKPHYTGHRARLRQRFLDAGEVAVADHELLEMVLYGAIVRGDTKPLAKRLLARFGSFSAVIQAPASALREVEGVGDGVVATLKVVQVSAQKLLKEEIKKQPIINSWTALLDYCRLAMGAKMVEEFRVLFLNHKHVLIADEVQHTGTVNHTTAYPREVVKRALELGASSIILAHNHPSGDPTPSQADVDLTLQIQKAAKALGITLHDHLIIAKDKHFSFKAHEFI